MQTKYLSTLILCGALLSGRAAVVTWDGGGDGVNWSDPSNWSSDALPATTDDVVLGAGATLILAGINPTVQSVQSQRPFSITSGSLTLTAGASEVKGVLTLAQGTSLNVNGAGATFIATNSVNADGAGFSAQGGAQMRLPGLKNYSKPDGFCGDAYWYVQGAGSLLDLSAVTNVYAGNCAYLRIQALFGAQIIISNLVSLTNGYVQAYADGAGSVVDLRKLASFPSLDRAFVLEARNNGQVIMPLLTDGQRVYLTLRSGGVLDTAQFTRLAYVTVDNAILSLPAVTNVDGIGLEVYGGGRLSLPLIRSIIKPDGNCSDVYWFAQGAGSVLDLSTVTNAYGGNCATLRIQAIFGAQVIVSNLVSLTNGYVQAYADGVGSVVDLRSLPSFPSSDRYFTLEARNSGQVIMPLVSDGLHIGVVVRNGGLLDTAQFKRVANVVVENTVLTLPAVTNADSVNLEVYNGGKLSLPLIRNITKPDGYCGDVYWLAQGAGAVLDLSPVTNAYGGNCAYLRIQAIAGGQVVVSNLVSLTNGYVQAYADGAGSVVDLRQLASFPSSDRYFALEARNSGQVIMPLITDGLRMGIILRNAGVLDTAQLTRVAYVTVDNAILSLPAVTNVDGISLEVYNGGRLSLPLIKSIIKPDGNCSDVYWYANGAGSVLDLATVTNAYGGNCATLRIQAIAGGQVIVSNLVSLTNGYVQAYADGAGSVVDLRQLASFSSPDRLFALEARNSGQVIMPLLADGRRINLYLRNSGLLDTAQFTILNEITVDNSTLSLTSVTNLDAAYIYLYNAGKLTLPALQSITKVASCYSVVWQVQGTGSELNAPALATLEGGSCGVFNLEVRAGGSMILSNVVSISGASVNVLADGSGSTVDLTKLNSFLAPNGYNSSLTAQNGGIALLNTQAFLLANVIVNIPPGNPVLPPAFISGQNLTLYGTPWHSYLIEQRTTLIPNAGWQFSLHVPLTNTFQIVSGPPPANTAFRVSEWVANPSLLDFFRQTNQILVVFYSPTNETYQVQTSTNLASPAGWISNSIVTMTNTFRILGPVIVSEPQRYFRTKQL